MRSAGEALVLSSEKEPQSSRMAFITESPTYLRWKEAYEESESPAVETLRSITSTIGGWFDENETVKVIRTIREIDPDFRMDSFTRELREYIVPEVVDAYLSADRESLKQWCGEAVSTGHRMVFRDRSVCLLTPHLDVQRALGYHGPVHQAGPGVRLEDSGH